ncbi:MAG: esterase, partial [Hansschlegelia sp.]
QIPIDRSGRLHAAKLREAGYGVTYLEYDGPHAHQPEIVAQAVDFIFA